MNQNFSKTLANTEGQIFKSGRASQNLHSITIKFYEDKQQ